MLLYFGTNYTATLVGDAIHAVACRHCGGEYFYTACRISSGVATSPYNLGMKSAEARAGNIARRRLGQSLAATTDPVPCPHCGRLQPDMLRDLRKSRFPRWKTAAWVVPTLVLVPMAIVYLLASDLRWQAEVRPKLLGVMILIGGAGAAAWTFINTLAKAYDPDADLPGGKRAKPLPPAPPALVRTPWPATSNADSRAATEREFKTLLMPAPGALQAGAPMTAEGWVTVQLHRVAFPKACACCLGPPVTTYGDAVPKSNAAAAPPTLPLCARCGQALWRRWWKRLALTTLAGVVAGVIAACLIPMTDAGRNFVAFFFLPGVGLILGYSTAITRTPPHRCKNVDSGRGFFAVRFDNPEYTRLMIKKWADPETHARVVPDQQLTDLLVAAHDRKAA
jgi:hypothetical protein